MSVIKLEEKLIAVFENIAGEIFFEAKERKMYREFQLLEAVRCSISFLFEAKLWNSPEEAVEQDLGRIAMKVMTYGRILGEKRSG